jgi:hypothetical protein
VFVSGGNLSAQYSTFANNGAHAYSQSHSGRGGAIALAGATSLIQHSTISGNNAEYGGGLVAYGTGSAIVLLDSTISGNSAGDSGALEASGNTHAYVYNTTIAFNRATYSDPSSIAGVHAGAVYAQSSIFAYNVASNALGSVETDVKSMNGAVGGAKNLILAAVATTLPSDTSPACPRLAPLLNNGGPTRTHALLAGSPAIDAGNDTVPLGVDQRGAGFDRVVGAFADIGAYEWSADPADDINNNGFDCQ